MKNANLRYCFGAIGAIIFDICQPLEAAIGREFKWGV